jgi:hypothetical protein
VYTGSAISGAGGGDVLLKRISKTSLVRVHTAISGMQQPIPVNCVQSVRSSGSQVLTLLALLVQKYKYRQLRSVCLAVALRCSLYLLYWYKRTNTAFTVCSGVALRCSLYSLYLLYQNKSANTDTCSNAERLQHQLRTGKAAEWLSGTRSLYLLYWYKRTNTDT